MSDSLMEFRSRVSDWDVLLNRTPSATESQREAAIDELNEFWPFHGEEFYFNGIGVFPMQIEQDDGQVVVRDGYGEVTNGFGISAGVAVVQITDEHPWKIMHQFLVQRSVQLHCLTVATEQQVSIFMDPQNMTLFSPDEVEAAYDTTGEPLAEGRWESFLQRRADQLIKTMGTVTFNRLSARAREARLSAFVVKTESRLEQFRQSEATICGERGYVLSPGQPRKVDISRDAIAGMCLGLDVLRQGEQAEEDKGLCLVISPDEGTRTALHISPLEAMHIPISSQQLIVEFD